MTTDRAPVAPPPSLPPDRARQTVRDFASLRGRTDPATLAAAATNVHGDAGCGHAAGAVVVTVPRCAPQKASAMIRQREVEDAEIDASDDDP